MKDVNILTSNGIDVNHGIELLGDMETYDSILLDFHNGYMERMNKISTYKNNSNMANYAIEVHSLKSDSKYLGFMKLADLAYNHEMASKSGEIDKVNAGFNELVTEANRIEEVIKKYLESTAKEEEQREFIPDIVETKASPEPVGEATQVVSNDMIEKASKAILVADDSSIIRNFVDEIFSNEYQILKASNGQEVINIISSNRTNIKAILLDLNMPVIDGFGVLDYMNEHDLFKNIPVSIISGANDKDSIDKAFTYPIVDMLNKPFSKETVKLVVEKTIGL